MGTDRSLETANICGELWRDGQERLGGLVRALGQEAAPRTVAEAMATHALQRLLRSYLLNTESFPLPPYWQQWAVYVREQIRTETDFYVDGEVAEEQGGDQVNYDEVGLMQFGGSSSSSRLARPRRPAEWCSWLRRLQATTQTVRANTLIGLQEWLRQRVNRLGHPFVIHGLMFRDCLGQNCGLHMTPEERRQATDMTQEAMGIVQNYLNTYLRQQCGALQDPILNAANDLAAMYDETAVDVIPLGLQEQEHRNGEEVRLQYQVNGRVRKNLPAGPRDRDCVLRVLVQAMRRRIGSEARHLRRMCMELQGLLLIRLDSDLDDEDTPEPNMEEQQWVNDMVDDLQLMAAQEGDADSGEARWYVELRRLRRWLADDRFVDDYHPYFAAGEDDDMREPEDTQVAEAVPEQEEENMVLE